MKATIREIRVPSDVIPELCPVCVIREIRVPSNVIPRPASLLP